MTEDHTVAEHPLVRLVVVNFNGGAMTVRCLENLLDLEWPPDRLELVLVDNGSTDGVANDVEELFPQVKVIRSDRNRGFAGGANLGATDLGQVSYIGYVNNDAFPAKDWLRPLVDAMDAEPDLGAASPKILIAPRFVGLRIESPTFTPATSDSRSLGVMVSGIRVDGVDAISRAIFKSGAHGWEQSARGRFQWTNGDAELWCPFEADGDPPASLEVELAASKDESVRVSSGRSSTTIDVDSEPRWYEARPDGVPFDVINNVGSRLVAGGWAGDRGFLEPDSGQYDERAEVFAWCGAAVLLRRQYFEDLGGFDDDLFLYYEDTDLSWRGRLRGWRYSYVPSSRVRHIHSATSGEGSALFSHYVDRNRLLVYLRNAPPAAVADAVAKYVSETARIAIRDVVRPALRREDLQPYRTKQKARSFAGFIRHGPAALMHRRHQGNSISRRAVAAWAEKP